MALEDTWDFLKRQRPKAKEQPVNVFGRKVRVAPPRREPPPKDVRMRGQGLPDLPLEGPPKGQFTAAPCLTPGCNTTIFSTPNQQGVCPTCTPPEEG